MYSISFFGVLGKGDDEGKGEEDEEDDGKREEPGRLAGGGSLGICANLLSNIFEAGKIMFFKCEGSEGNGKAGSGGSCGVGSCGGGNNCDKVNDTSL